ncbi:glycosyltransferase family 39 protein [Anabaena subtropica]|uniref:Glycosyltransferase family 39 protein n=1 Tax=Anabaena subtropica FACHB-260 TaxID=2692884 RepID=A0ABR8CRK9_9NOST|nr:glycosyltransferase family 39 protein [Anabaena subtropica]MBD2345841.1 glycosyltransferase family 39 protein [Anabaena subtropica FACHB-260]
MRHFRLVPSWLRFLMILLLVMCILFRFVYIDRKVYSLDETYTSLRISGYTVAEVTPQIFNGRIISRENFTEFQRPNLNKNVNDIVMSLAVESPDKSPLYYIIARFWVEIFGNSVIVIRYLSALISLLVFPCLYLLCRELFNVTVSLPSLAIALMANSPMHLVYAQESREYILWLVTIILASTALLRAIRLQSIQKSDPFTTWGIYVITLALSLYTCLWTIFVAIAHGVYVVLIAKLRLTETVRSYFIATIFGFLAFFPWLMIVFAKFFQFILSSDGINNQDLNVIPLIPFLVVQISRSFFDLNIGLDNQINYLISPFFLILLLYGIYFLYRTTNYQIWLFIITLIVVPALPLILPAISSGGLRLGSEPYLLPSYLGIQIIVAYLLATQMYNGNLSQRRIWQFIIGLLIICGLVSSRVYYQADTWWNKGVSYGNPQIARFINQKSRPLLISNYSEINYGNVFSLSYLLESKTRFQLMPDQKLPNIPNNFTDIFLLNPTNAWRLQIANKYQLQPNLVYGDDHYLVWKLVKPRDAGF